MCCDDVRIPPGWSANGWAEQLELFAFQEMCLNNRGYAKVLRDRAAKIREYGIVKNDGTGNTLVMCSLCGGEAEYSIDTQATPMDIRITIGDQEQVERFCQSCRDAIAAKHGDSGNRLAEWIGLVVRAGLKMIVS